MRPPLRKAVVCSPKGEAFPSGRGYVVAPDEGQAETGSLGVLMIPGRGENRRLRIHRIPVRFLAGLFVGEIREWVARITDPALWDYDAKALLAETTTRRDLEIKRMHRAALEGFEDGAHGRPSREWLYRAEYQADAYERAYLQAERQYRAVV